MTAIVLNDHIKQFCKPGTIFCCRYLVVSNEGFECVKSDLELKALLDQRVEDNAIRAVGDNCEGIENIDKPESTEQPVRHVYLSRYALSILSRGPRRVLVDDNYAVSRSRAAEIHGITPDIIFIRDDGWSLGAPKHLANQAEELWVDEWIGVLIRGKSQPLTMDEYHELKEDVQ